jgi:hypothetical protein
MGEVVRVLGLASRKTSHMTGLAAATSVSSSEAWINGQGVPESLHLQALGVPIPELNYFLL